MTSIANIVDALASQHTIWRTLHGVEPQLCDGRPDFVVGNAAVTFRVRHNGEQKTLKCYTRTNAHLQSIYGTEYHPRELCVIDIVGRKVWIDCLLTPYIEGVTLDEKLCMVSSTEELWGVATAFDLMAYKILASERAHGDLKPENIIITPRREMVAIDWDAAFLPTFAGELAAETGTAAYQHPSRDAKFYDKHIDDYSIAFLTVFLYAAAIDPATLNYFKQHKEPAISPREILRGATSELERISDLFAARGMAREYRIAQMLRSTNPRLFNLTTTISPPAPPHYPDTEQPTLDQVNGFWGCHKEGNWIIAPHFDNGYEPTDGFMLAELGGYRHFVALDGRIAKSFEQNTRIKPMRDGYTTAYYADGRSEIIKAEELLQNLDK